MSPRRRSSVRTTRRSSSRHNLKNTDNSTRTENILCSCTAFGCLGCGSTPSLWVWLMRVLPCLILAAIIVLILYFVGVIGNFRSNDNNNNSVTTASINPNEVNGLQTMLFVNQFQYAMLSYGQATFNATAFNVSGYAPFVHDYLTVIMHNEQANTNTWSNLLSNNGYTPNDACLMTFTSITTIAQYLTFLNELINYENGVYLDLLNTINNLQVKESVMQTATTTSQEQAFLLQWANGTESGSPFPTSDNTLYASTLYTPSQMFLALQAYYSCSSSIVLPASPTIEYNGLSYNTTSGTTIITGPVVNGTNLASLNYTHTILVNDLQVLIMSLAIENLLSIFYQIFQNESSCQSSQSVVDDDQCTSSPQYDHPNGVQQLQFHIGEFRLYLC
jgi:hypothetical protein